MKVQLRSIMGDERKQEYEVDAIYFNCDGWTHIRNNMLIFSIVDMDKVTICHTGEELYVKPNKHKGEQ